ncbi:LysR family transcriptional regulator (plasmid) [Cupriavidus basilensis]|uniref:LysR family transcriptional regulator n=2 Tax=Cupriavidus basilensis TaxID=68895 RepID=A0A7M2HC15_9BURK|nr:LysR family transcriptional regulator [Cupriavidus basilensis]QOT82486.1 LysR family transcriptional regulator [Cupriavidus basilensis]
MTFKQLEAIYWVAQLGGFSQAALKLHTTQPAVSKRVQELEDAFGTPLFDRSLRSARLTQKGEEMFRIAKDLLERRELAINGFATAEPPERQLRIGVTELTAMTWLPRFVNEVQSRFPNTSFEPDIDDSFGLRNKLLEDQLDIAILPDMFEDSRLAKTRLGKVVNAWMAKSGIFAPQAELTVHNIASQRVLSQGVRSATGALYEKWFKAAGIASANRIVSNNLMATIGMTVSGLGVAHLPRHCLQPFVDLGMLEVLRVVPPVPDVAYVAACKADRHSVVLDELVSIAVKLCDFDRAFQAT